MITVTRICDCCDKQVADGEQFWFVEVRYREQNTRSTYGDGFSKAGEVQWCRPCCEKHGLVPFVPMPQHVPQVISLGGYDCRDCERGGKRGGDGMSETPRATIEVELEKKSDGVEVLLKLGSGMRTMLTSRSFGDLTPLNDAARRLLEPERDEVPDWLDILKCDLAEPFVDIPIWAERTQGQDQASTEAANVARKFAAGELRKTHVEELRDESHTGIGCYVCERIAALEADDGK